MTKWLAFVAGGLFALGLVITCGGRNDGAGSPATAGGSVVWEYATLYDIADGVTTMPSGVSAPAGAASCKDTACRLNAFGADRWELASYSSSNATIVFKRPK